MKSFMKKSRRAFTIVELVIVIAVIAILAAVLIPTFVSVIDSANESSDIQATKNMNTALYSEEILNGKPSNLAEAKEVLSEAGYKDTLSPVTDKYSWYWNSEYNIVMLIEVDSNGDWNLIYPTTNDAGEAYTKYSAYCYSLYSDTNLVQDTLLSATKITVTSATTDYDSVDATSAASNAGWDNIVYLANEIGEDFEGVEITLSANLDLTNVTDLDPIHEFKGTFNGSNCTITLSANAITPEYGASGNGYLYYEMAEKVTGTNSYNVQKFKYGYGLFAAVTDGGTISNLTVKYNDTESTATDPYNEYTYFGGIVGILVNGTISNCNVSGDIVQYNRVGGIVGTALNGEITNCTMTANITSLAVSKSTSGRTSGFDTYSYAGGIVAYAGNHVSDAGTLKITDCNVGGDTAIIIKSSSYGTGGYVAWATNGEVVVISGGTIKNVTLSRADSSTSYVGVVCGRLHADDGYANLSFTGLTVDTSITLTTYVGYISNGCTYNGVTATSNYTTGAGASISN